jgi:transposase-like protein
MPRYEKEFKEQTVLKMMPPNAISVARLSRETGVSEGTLYNWRNEYRRRGVAVPADPSNPERWSGENKLSVVVETAALNETELAEYCRKKGLYPEQVDRWREAAILGNASADQLDRAAKKAVQQERKRNKLLERELRRKDKALAETAALLVLRKKAQAIWGDAGEG